MKEQLTDSESMEELRTQLLGKYNIIYADPPWKYKENWGNGSNEHTYPTMTNSDIEALPIADITADQAHLYLWVTNPFIEQGLAVCKAWGFEYKTMITWIKTYSNGDPEMGMGYYFRGCTEHIIFGVKGKMKVLNKTTKNMFIEKNPRKHSQKPASTRDMIVACSGDLPRIELFARQQIKGWDTWGNEVNTSIGTEHYFGRIGVKITDNVENSIQTEMKFSE